MKEKTAQEYLLEMLARGDYDLDTLLKILLFVYLYNQVVLKKK